VFFRQILKPENSAWPHIFLKEALCFRAPNVSGQNGRRFRNALVRLRSSHGVRKSGQFETIKPDKSENLRQNPRDALVLA
jgi:hypothetical protein